MYGEKSTFLPRQIDDSLPRIIAPVLPRTACHLHDHTSKIYAKLKTVHKTMQTELNNQKKMLSMTQGSRELENRRKWS